jgi:ferrous iron transport protein B
MEYKKILIIGRPNVGKTSFVNCLAGSKLKVGNFAGVTTQMQSVATSIDNKIVELIDSPGLYSINSPSGRDEEEVVKFLEQVDKFDFILNVLDATKIQSELILTQEILNLKLNKPMAICLNSYDIALKNGIEIDIEKLKQSLQIPIIRLNSCNSFSPPRR